MTDRIQDGFDSRLEDDTNIYKNEELKNKVSNFKNVNIACEHEEKIQNDIGIHFPPLQYCLKSQDPSGTYFKTRKAEIHNLNKKD